MTKACRGGAVGSILADRGVRFAVCDADMRPRRLRPAARKGPDRGVARIQQT